MKNNKGITLTSLIIYILAMLILSGTIMMLTNYFYKNFNELSINEKTSSEYTEFTSYLSNDLSAKNISNVFSGEDNQITIKFNNNEIHKYFLVDNNIYYQEIKENEVKTQFSLCNKVEDMVVTLERNTVKITIKFDDKNTYDKIYSFEKNNN